jgi:hypothetical protein
MRRMFRFRLYLDIRMKWQEDGKCWAVVNTAMNFRLGFLHYTRDYQLLKSILPKEFSLVAA